MSEAGAATRGSHAYKVNPEIDRLLKQQGVIDVKSNFVLERVKDTTALPLPLHA